ncbi:solute carrier organic anion transporter family member 1C1-like [Aplochiton taeniatus]
MGDPAEASDRLTSQQALCVPDKNAQKSTCCDTLKMFIMALSFAYFSKALAGTYMKSSITQIERRFDLSSSQIGVIDGSFEMGNLLFLAAVSHFGAKLHRPRLIGVGCFLMSVGSLLTGLPHFFMGRYTYDTVIQGSQNGSLSIAACVDAPKRPDTLDIQVETSDGTACVKDPSSHMWIYVFLGNVLRGIGETPVTPLGISYIDDFAKAENSPFYIACLQTISLLGPMFGFLLGSYCARLYVDVGYVDLESVTITSKDARWVGAWWMGFFVSSVILLLAGIPFWFLPRSLPKQGGEKSKLPENPDHLNGTEEALQWKNIKLAELAKGFMPSLKRLLRTPAYALLLCGSILKFNSFIGLLTFKAKYMEQQFGQSASRANFLIGVLNLPVVAVGIFLGGLLMKRYKLGVVSGAQLSFATSFMAYLLVLLQFGTKCDNIPVAGLTMSYNGTRFLSYHGERLYSECNRDCSCSVGEWDPVCSKNGIIYTSPCMAGCSSSSGFGKTTVFHNCSCVSSSRPPGGSMSVTLGQCPRGRDCSRSFTSYMAVSVLSSFINSLGATPGYMVIIRCISPELKSLALGIQTLAVRALGGIPAPVYFGALIDTTCLKWGIKKCGGRGACRMYDSDMYRIIFLGLITSLSGTSYFFIIPVIILLRKQFRAVKGYDKDCPIGHREIELQTPSEHSANQTNGTDTHSAPPTLKDRMGILVQQTGERGKEELLPQSEAGKVLSTAMETEPIRNIQTEQANDLSQRGEEEEEPIYSEENQTEKGGSRVQVEGP